MDIVILRENIGKIRDLYKRVDKNWTEGDEKHWENHKQFLSDYYGLIEKGAGEKYQGEVLEAMELVGEWFSMRHGYAATYFPAEELIPTIKFAMKYNIFKAFKMYRALRKEDKYYAELEHRKDKEGKFLITSEQSSGTESV